MEIFIIAVEETPHTKYCSFFVENENKYKKCLP